MRREDLNEHVGFNRLGFDWVHESFEYGSRNQERGGGIKRCLIL
jgi:hypothetical protein